MGLKEELVELQDHLTKKTDKVLRPGVKEADFKKLATALGVKTLPEDLKTWFGWHNGQKDIVGLGDDTDYRMLSLSEAIKDHKDLVREIKGVKAVPLLENIQQGDCLVWDFKSGALFYWNLDDKLGKKVFNDLAAFIQKQNKSYRKIKAPVAGLPAITKSTAWEPVSKVTPQGVRKDPVGTLYSRKKKEKTSYLGKLDHRHYFYYKVSDDRWVEIQEPSESMALKAYEKLVKIGIPANPKDPIFKNDKGVHFLLTYEPGVIKKMK